MMYDRVPVLPTEIKKDSGSFEDLKLNTKKRVVSPFYQKRQYPRVLLDADVEYRIPKDALKDAGMPEEGTIHVFDFNYCYACIDDKNMPKKLVLMPQEKWHLECEFETELRSGLKLYRVLNSDAIWAQKEVMEDLLAWLVKTNDIACKRTEEREMQKKAEEKAEKNKEDFNETNLV